MFVRENVSRSLDRSIFSKFGQSDTQTRLDNSVDVNIYESAKDSK